MNSLTHGVAAALSIAALTVLVVFSSLQGDPWKIVSFSIYGATLIALYTASTVYHAVPSPRLRPFLRRIDHSCIYLLIAGTYTPFMLVVMRDAWGWTLFGLVWGSAVLGIVFIGYRHFDNIQTGVAAASLYLLLPYSAFMVGRLDHIIPAALLVWAVATYRRPVLSGLLIGAAAGLTF